ncbi:MAG TPA: cysteine peptidase family C39 domain-containing protein [Planctomycetaceae bacterium]|nr:cysteine peptidase family C39 domain-containing protein [Planctomycetaceae bacterium]
MRLAFHCVFAIASFGLLTMGTAVVDEHAAGAESGFDVKSSSLACKGSSESQHWREAESCGVACGYMLARLRGRHINYSDAVSAIAIENGGTSLLALQEGLRRLGVATTSLKATPRDLDRIAMPVIAHMLPRRETSSAVGHFLLVLRVDDHSVRYVEPNYAASIETVPRNQFLRCWSGYLVAPTPHKAVFETSFKFALCTLFAIVLTILLGVFPHVRWYARRRPKNCKLRAMLLLVGLVGASSLTTGCATMRPSSHVPPDVSLSRPQTEDPSRLVVWSTEADLGALPRDGVAEAIFRIENQGDSQVCLHLGMPTCRCSEARLERDVLKPGESTNVCMMMRSRPHQAGPAEARVYVEAEKGRWAEMLSVHAVELGANFPDCTYAIGGSPPATQKATVVGNMFVKASASAVKVDVPLSGSGLESLLVIRDLRVGSTTQMTGYARRDCSFTVELNSKTGLVKERREVALPVSVTLDGRTTLHRIRLIVLPSARSAATIARNVP